MKNKMEFYRDKYQSAKTTVKKEKFLALLEQEEKLFYDAFIQEQNKIIEQRKKRI